MMTTPFDVPAVLDSAVDYGIFTMDLEGRVTFWNKGAERLFGFSAEEMLGRSGAVIFIPEDRLKGAPEQELRQALREGRARDQRWHIKKDGQRFWADGILTPVKDPDGTSRGLVKILRDLTEAKESEERLSNWNRDLERTVRKRTEELAQQAQELQAAQRMEAVGRLAGGVAHDFNNLITGIAGLAEELRQNLPEGDQRRQDAEEIVRACQHAFDVTRQLLAFSRRQPVHPKVVDVNQLIFDFGKMLRRLIGEDIALDLLLANDLPPVLIDPGQFQQILMNLAVNARDAMPAGGTLTVRTHAEALAANQVPPLPAGRYTSVEVADTGGGMTPEVLAHIFEPFFSTKEKGHGTGLGLSVVYGIVKQSNGEITVTSRPDQGTAFRIYWPESTGVYREERRGPDRPITLKGHETILVVEDEDIVRRVTCGALSKNGYHVLAAPNGEEALRISRANHDPIDLVLTDVMMPGMSGPDLVNHLSQERPTAKILYMSGHDAGTFAARGIAIGRHNFIEKTFTPNRLCQRVRQILDQTPSRG